jgi:hypothetical protein
MNEELKKLNIILTDLEKTKLDARASVENSFVIESHLKELLTLVSAIYLKAESMENDLVKIKKALNVR